ncbi:MAG: hypothetical protein ACI8PG_000407 [Planctomycetota bacterium]|jgi:hypothetical protein
MPAENGQDIDWQKQLPAKLRLALWKRVDRRLQHGDVLMTDEHFQKLMEREFLRLVHVKPSPKISAAIMAMVIRVNEEHPNKYLGLGIKNMMIFYTRTLLDRLEDHSEEAFKEGQQRIKKMMREGRTALFLESIGIELGPRGLPPSIEKAIHNVLNGKEIEVQPQILEHQKSKKHGPGMADVRISEAALKVEEEAEGPAQAPLPNEDECKDREERMLAREQEINSEEVDRASNYLDSYREQNLIDDEEVSMLTALYGIDSDLAQGKINLEEAERRRSKIGNREAVDKKLEQAVTFAVQYINAFEGLRRLPQERDAVCRLLIRQKESAMAERGDEGLLEPLITELDRNDDLLESAIKLLERRDHEARMLSANLPPYRYITGQGKIGNWLIEESFIDELRTLQREELSVQLNSADQNERVRPAAAVRCLVALINQMINPTPLHMAVIRLHLRKTIARLYSSMPQAKNGRQKVGHYLKQRMPRLYPDLTAEDQELIHKESEEIMANIEAEREAGGGEGDKMRVYRV